MKTYDGIIICMIVGAVVANCLCKRPEPSCEIIPILPCGRPHCPCRKEPQKKKPCEDCYYRYVDKCR